MKQQIRLVLKEGKKFVKDLNPRALRFEATNRPIVNGKRKNVDMELEWCDLND